MLVFNDINFVYCALATVSAAVGYSYTRRTFQRPNISSRVFNFPLHYRKARRNSTSSDESCDTPISVDTDDSECVSATLDYPTPVSIADNNEPDSLKRKRSDEDDTNDHPDYQSATPPSKRLRSSSLPIEEERPEVSHPEPLDMEVTPDPQSAEEPLDLVTDAVAATSENLPSATSVTAALNGAGYNIPAYKPSAAFAAFAGSSSPFSLAANPACSQRPAWCTVAPPTMAEVSAASDETEKEKASTEASIQVVESTVAPSTTTTEATDDPLAALSYTPCTHTLINGEEDEDINAELRGVKLFIKRGMKDFSAGILGHIKYLRDKHTGEERLVFRRESVWKVSMSVRLRPSIRCTFEEEQGVLRIALKELDQESNEQHIVVYALKRGKTPKHDFTEFARDVLRSAHLSNQLERCDPSPKTDA